MSQAEFNALVVKAATSPKVLEAIADEVFKILKADTPASRGP